jgi:putative glutamine amidotransferase
MLEVPAQRFMVAVQFHPEELYAEHPVWSRLFGAFIDACKSQYSLGQQQTSIEVLPVDQDDTLEVSSLLAAS